MRKEPGIWQGEGPVNRWWWQSQKAGDPAPEQEPELEASELLLWLCILRKERNG